MSTKNNINKVKIISSFIAFFLILAIVFITLYFTFKTEKDYTVIGTVNGTDIYYGELRDQMNRDKASVISEFSEKYNADVNQKDFWNKKYNGTTPLEYLRKKSAETVKKFKLEQQLAVKYGIIKKDEITYESFLKQLQSQNSNRSQKVENRDVVYGASSYNKDTYYSYITSIIEIELIAELGKEKGILYANDKQLKKYYNQIKHEEYLKSPIAEYDDIYITFNGGAEESNISKKEAKKIMNEILNIIKTNSDYKNKIKSKYNQIEFYPLLINEDTQRQLQKETPILYEAAVDLQKGDVSSIIELQNTFHILKCKTFKNGGYKSFEENKDSIAMQYRQAKYDEYIKSLCNKHVIEWNKKYESVTIE